MDNFEEIKPELQGCGGRCIMVTEDIRSYL